MLSYPDAFPLFSSFIADQVLPLRLCLQLLAIYITDQNPTSNRKVLNTEISPNGLHSEVAADL